MKDIDKYQAPRGCYAVAPEEYSNDGIGECNGRCFDSGSKRHRNSPRSNDLCCG